MRVPRRTISGEVMKAVQVLRNKARILTWQREVNPFRSPMVNINRFVFLGLRTGCKYQCSMTDVTLNYTIYITRRKALKRSTHISCSRIVFSPLCPYCRWVLGFGTSDIAQRQ